MSPLPWRWLRWLLPSCGLLALSIAQPEAAAPPTAGVPDRSPTDLIVSTDEKWLLTANRTSDTISVVNLVVGKVVAESPAGRRPRALALTPDGSRVLVTATHSGELTVFAL